MKRTATDRTTGEVFTRRTDADYSHVAIGHRHETWHHTRAAAEASARRMGGRVIEVDPVPVATSTRRAYIASPFEAFDGIRRVYRAASANDPDDRYGDIAWSIAEARRRADSTGIDADEAVAYITG